MKEFINHFALYRHQSFLVVTAISLPFVFNLIYVSRAIPGLTKDLSPMALAISGVLFTISIVKYHLLELNPPPRGKFCDYFDTGAVIIDENGTIVDYNTAGAAFIDCGDIDLIGKSFYDLYSACPNDIGELTMKTIEPGPNGEVRRCIIFEPFHALYPNDVIDHPAASEEALCFSILSKRELQVAELLAADIPLKEIASRLFISINTVKTHERCILKKTGARTRLDLARLLEEEVKVSHL
jgi:DNA-binding CsgD family transcriptional regulator